MDADISASTDLLGKFVTDLQENVIISNGVVNGTSKYVTGYTGFSSDPDLQHGNYIAIKAEQEGATSIGWRRLGSTAEPALLDADGILILRITKQSRGFEIVTVDDGETFVNRFVFNLEVEEERGKYAETV